MGKFDITLKNEKYRLYDRFAVLIFIINAIGIIFSMFYFDHTTDRNRTGLLTLLLLLLSILLYISTPQKVKKEYYFIFASFFASLYWLLLGYWWVGLAVLLLAVLYKKSKRLLIVTVDIQHISYPSLLSKKINWNQISNIILKDGLLTIDLKNNKFIQQPVDESKTRVNEQEFNDFCQQQLNP